MIWALALILSLSISLSLSSAEPEEPAPKLDKTNFPKTRVVSGAFTRPLSNVLVYSGTAPLIFELTMNMTRIEKSRFVNENCELRNTSRSECKILEGVERMIEEIETKLTLLQNSIRASPFGPEAEEEIARANRLSRKHRNVVQDFLGGGFQWCCSLATTADIDRIFTNERDLHNVFEKMKTSIITDHSNIMMIKKAYKNLSSNITLGMSAYKRAILKSVEDQKRLRDELEGHYEFVNLFNRKMTLIGAQLTQAVAKVSDVMQYNDILSHCKAQLLPMSAVGRWDLMNDLFKMQAEVRKYGYDIAFDPTESIRLYTHKFTSCQFANNRIRIVVKVPLRHLNENYQIHELITVPFVYQDSLCYIDHAPTLLAVSSNDIIALQGTDLQGCNPKEGICYLSSFTTDPQESYACSKAIHQGATVQELKEACSMTCRKLPPTSNLITQIDVSRYVLTNPPIGTTIHCDSKEPIPAPIPVIPNRFGATEVALSCGCYIRMPGRKRHIRSPYPCPPNQHIKPQTHFIVPSHWVKINTNVASEMDLSRNYLNTLNAHSFDDIEDLLNSTWVLDGTINVTAISAMINDIQLPTLVHKLPSVSSFLLYLWNIPLSIAVLYLMVKVMNPNFNALAATLGLSQYMRTAQGAEVKIPDHAYPYYTAAMVMTVIFTATCVVIGLFSCFVILRHLGICFTKKRNLNIEVLRGLHQPVTPPAHEMQNLSPHDDEEIHVPLDSRNTIKIIRRTENSEL